MVHNEAVFKTEFKLQEDRVLGAEREEVSIKMISNVKNKNSLRIDSPTSKRCKKVQFEFITNSKYINK